MRLAIILTTTAFAASIHAQTGTISGRVLDPSGAPVSGAAVLCGGFPNYTGGVPANPSWVPNNVSVKSGSDGGYQCGGLTPGVYYLCAVPPSPGLLASCTYNRKPVTVSVESGQQASGPSLTLPAGARVLVRVLDPAGLIASGHRLSAVSFPGEGTYEIGKVVSQSAGEVDYGITIPLDRVSNLMVQTDLSVTDAAGAAVPLLQPVIPLPLPTTPSTTQIVVLLNVQ